jgi:two-component system CheB/CheR fusion protein
VGQHATLFKPLARKWRIYQRLDTAARERLELHPTVPAARESAEAPIGAAAPARPTSLAAIAQTMILERFAPAAVLVNGKHEVLYYAGPTDRYLRQPRGAPSNHLLTLARDGLRATLSRALRRSAGSDASVVALGGSIKRNGGLEPVKISVTPIAGTGSEAEGRVFLVVFQDELRPAAQRARGKTKRPAPVRQLEEELRATREDLQASIDRLEHANEDLRVAHEEVVSGNEELQATNEELESSKEEMQSLNEELTAVNQQLQAKIGEVESANNDLTNLLDSSDVATACLDRGLRIRWLTPAARGVLNMIAADIGRPISDLASTLAGESLLRDAREVLERLAPVETEVRASDGRAYLRRTLPYRTTEHKIDGVVVNFADITETRRVATVALEASEERGVPKIASPADVRARAAPSRLAEETERERSRATCTTTPRVLHGEAEDRRPDEGAGPEAAQTWDLDALIAQGGPRSLAVFQLNPPVPESAVPALEAGQEISARTPHGGSARRWIVQGLRKPATQGHRAVRELLINVAKHAGVERQSWKRGVGYHRRRARRESASTPASRPGLGPGCAACAADNSSAVPIRSTLQAPMWSRRAAADRSEPAAEQPA